MELCAECDSTFCKHSRPPYSDIVSCNICACSFLSHTVTVQWAAMWNVCVMFCQGNEMHSVWLFDYRLVTVHLYMNNITEATTTKKSQHIPLPWGRRRGPSLVWPSYWKPGRDRKKRASVIAHEKSHELWVIAVNSTQGNVLNELLQTCNKHHDIICTQYVHTFQKLLWVSLEVPGTRSSTSWFYY